MNCPTCKNPIMNPAPTCEWCGSILNVNEPKEFNELQFNELCLKYKKEAFDYYSQFYFCDPKEVETIINYLASPKKHNYFSNQAIKILRIKHQKSKK